MPECSVREIGNCSQTVKIPRNVGGSRGVEENKKRHLLTGLPEFLSHGIGDPSSEGVAGQVVGTFRLQRADLSGVVRGHLLHRFVRRNPTGQFRRLQTVNRTPLIHGADKMDEGVDVAAVSMDKKQRRLVPFGPKRHERTPSRSPVLAFHHRGKFGDRLGLENERDGKAVTDEFLDFMRQFRRQQRMASEFEEIVVSPDTVFPEETGPDGCQPVLEQVPRGEIVGPRSSLADFVGMLLQQRAPVDRAVGRNRKTLDQMQLGRHHVGRQFPAELRFDCRRIGSIRRRANNECGQGLFAIAALADGDDGITNTGHLAQSRLDFPGLDPEAADFDLII